MRRHETTRLPDACPASGTHLALTWDESKERSIERACTACGRLLAMRVYVGGAAARKLQSTASAQIPLHHRRREGAPP